MKTKILKNLLPAVFTMLICYSGLIAQNLLDKPESAVFDSINKRYLISNYGDGSIIAIDSLGQHSYFNQELESIAGILLVGDTLYAASYQGSNPGLIGFRISDNEMVVNLQFVGMDYLCDIAADTSGNLYITDAFANKIFVVDTDDWSYSTIDDNGLNTPDGIFFDEINNRLLILNSGAPNGQILSLTPGNPTLETFLETGISGLDGIAKDRFGNYYLSSWSTDKVYRYDQLFANPPEIFASGYTAPGDIYCNNVDDVLVVPDFFTNTVDFINFGIIINVPDDKPTIQAGIDAALPGDTVLVAPGTYFENINFKGKNIVVASHFILDNDLNFITSTIIDGSNPATTDTASCVMFFSGEDSTAVLQGFTIKGGTGTHWIDPQFPTYTWHSGGGIFIFQSSPTIKNNYIIDNHVDDNTGVSGASGGGICMYGGNPYIFNNIIKSNTALYGAGVVIDYSGCVFKNNIVAQNCGGQNYGGGGFWTIGNGTEAIIIENNTIVDNESELKGGAMYLWSTQLTARNNIIWGNTQTTGNQIFLYDGANAEITYSDVEGGYTGEGNIELPPQFADTNFILIVTSPCIDAGNPDEIYNDPEDEQNPGQALWPSLGQLRNDMGVYGGPYTCLLQDVITGIINKPSPFQEISVEVFPNPFSEFTTISVRGTLPGSEQMIEIKNIKGQIIKQILISNQSTEHIWNGKNNEGDEIQPGIYFCNLVSINSKETVKVIKFN